MGFPAQTHMHGYRVGSARWDQDDVGKPRLRTGDQGLHHVTRRAPDEVDNPAEVVGARRREPYLDRMSFVHHGLEVAPEGVAEVFDRPPGRIPFLQLPSTVAPCHGGKDVALRRARHAGGTRPLERITWPPARSPHQLCMS